MVQNLHILTVQKVQKFNSKFNSKFNKTIKEASMEDSLMKKEICQVCQDNILQHKIAPQCLLIGCYLEYLN